jgi:hypothetical protein
MENEIEDDELVDISGWPMCAVDGCPNHCCLALESKYCWPHTIIGRNLGELESVKEEVNL